MLLHFSLADITDETERIIILGPVHYGQVATIKARPEQVPVRNPSIGPETLSRIRVKPDLLQVRRIKTKEAVILLRRRAHLEVAPVGIITRPVNRMVFA